MTVTATTRVINIGNSRGIRIPKLMLDQLGQVDEVELLIEQEQLVVRPRDGWDEQFKLMAERGDDTLLDEDVLSSSRWDAEESEWA